MEYRLLNTIDRINDLKTLSIPELQLLAEELRHYIIESISKTGGHLAPSLGVVELTIALLYVFDTPEDSILWDVGHQAYPWKVLTGRRESLKNIRQYGGISGFQKRTESPYDAFGAGHASTSISAGLGFSLANYLMKKDRNVVAVIGDGALTGGLAYEGLNNAGHLRRQLMVILNDNEMSISPNVGAISKHLHKVVTNPLYNRIRDELWDLTNRLPGKLFLRQTMRKIEESLKVLVVPGVIFDEMGFRYFGPLDGHDLPGLIDSLQKLKTIKTPVLLHILTKKGKGLAEAEKDPAKFHGIKGRGPVSGGGSSVAGYTEVFGNTLTEIAEAHPEVVGVTAAMCDGTGMNIFMEKFPDRSFDVGIAEGHAVTFSAGLAANGIRPFTAIYSTFLQRAVDSIFHDVSLQKLPVTFCIDRAGLVGEDGPTHHGVFDLTYLSMLPGAIVTAPKDGNELRALMHSSLSETEAPYFIRYPRDNSIAYDPGGELISIPTGTWERLRSGKKLAVLAVGSMVKESREAIEAIASRKIDPTLVNARFIKPLDSEMLKEIFSTHDMVVTVEEGSPGGGLHSAVMRMASEIGTKCRVKAITLPDAYITHGARKLILDDAGLSADKLAEKFKALY